MSVQHLVAFLSGAVISYLLGCFNGAVIVSKYILRDDVRAYGSGNAGLTNFYRTFGGPLTIVVILTDVLKAVAAILITRVLFGFFMPNETLLATYWAGLFCMLGHMFPCMFKFKGGKGILSGGTIAFLIDWRLALVCWGGFLILAVITKWVSLGSLSTGITFPLCTWLFVDPSWLVLLISLIIGILIIWKHRENLQRLLKGEESKFSLHRKKE